MSELQLYETSTNIRQQKNGKILSLSGSVNYSLFPNKSGKMTIKFTSPFSQTPIINGCLSCVEGEPLEQWYSLGKISNTEFTFHVSNNDIVNESKCLFMWTASNMC